MAWRDTAAGWGGVGGADVRADVLRTGSVAVDDAREVGSRLGHGAYHHEVAPEGKMGTNGEREGE